MPITLMMVTFNLDLSQFLMNETDRKRAVERAIEANKSEVLGYWDPDEILKKEINDPDNYTVDYIYEMDIILGIIQRTDWVDEYKGVIAFNG